MDFTIPREILDKLDELDAFIEAEIRPLERQDDNIRFFDHRREHARTDWDNGGLPRPEWEALLGEMRRRADGAGHLRYGLPAEYGGSGAGNLAMAVVREHLARKGLGLHNDLQNESSIVGNFPIVLAMRDFGTPEQVETYIEPMIRGEHHFAFGLTEPEHGSDATWMETCAVPETRNGVKGWRIDGEKMWTTGFHVVKSVLVFARTGGHDGDARGITCFMVPRDAEGMKAEEYLWTFNMPTDHPRVSLRNVWVPETEILGPPEMGLAIAQHFVHENRIRQAASSLGAAQFCIDESVGYAKARKPFGKPLSANQAIQFPLVELQTEAEMLRCLIHKTAWEMDRMSKREVAERISDRVAMCNYRANRLCCTAADTAMQVHGGLGYSRHKPFEHIYRHHRRYRITEGSEEIQMRKVAGHLFGYIKRAE
ncbi:MAG: acyl-CoA dehydrogenase family protein [Alphaproteobacteria bacterium]